MHRTRLTHPGGRAAMQIQDSSTSTIKDDRRRTTQDSRRLTFALGNNQADAFAELFQVIATSKVATNQTKDATANTDAIQPASQSGNAANQADEARDHLDDEAVEKDDDAQSNSVLQTLGQMAAVSSSRPDNQPSLNSEANGDSTSTIVDACCAEVPGRDVSEVSALTAKVTEDSPAQGLSEANADHVQARGKREQQGKDNAVPREVSAQQAQGDTRKKLDDAEARKTEQTSKVAKEPSESQSEPVTGDPQSTISSTNPTANDDRRRDRGEMLRDRLTGDEGPSQNVSDPTGPASSSPTGEIAIDPSLVATPTVAPEAVVAPVSIQATNVIASVAASAAVTSSTSSTVTMSGVASENNATTGVVNAQGSIDSMDDAKTASPMEQAPKSRQSEIADRARLIHRISKAFQKLGIDGGQVRLKMHPDDLGTVQLDMKISGSKVNASVIADNDAAARLLQEHLPDLRQRLESQGLTVDRLQVEQRTDSGSSSFSNQQSFQQQSEAFDEAARRQSQRSNYLSNTPVRGSTVPSVSTNLSPAVVSSARSDGSLDINF